MTTKATETKGEEVKYEETKGVPGDPSEQRGRKQTVVNNIIDGDKLKELFVKALDNFKKHNKRLPDLIVVFRDGVGESQRKKVIEEELVQVASSIQGYEEMYNPDLTLTFINKRIN